VETIGKIRRWHRTEKLSISQVARRLGASRKYGQEIPQEQEHGAEVHATRQAVL
jgi:hypothetical protein